LPGLFFSESWDNSATRGTKSSGAKLAQWIKLELASTLSAKQAGVNEKDGIAYNR
jgi:hypothetical protein